MASEQPRFPLSDTAYDVVSIVYQKSKALEAYAKFGKDLKEDDSLKQILFEIECDEKKHIEKLMPELGRLIMQPDTLNTER